MSIELIQQSVNRLIAEIRRYSSSQVELWRKVPWLALEADGRFGLNDNYARAFYHGVYGVKAPRHVGNYDVFVNLLTGDLISARCFRQERKFQLATNEHVLALAGRPEVLDAAALVARLEAESRKPYGGRYKRAAQEVWRQNVREMTRLKPIYDQTCKRLSDRT